MLAWVMNLGFAAGASEAAPSAAAFQKLIECDENVRITVCQG